MTYDEIIEAVAQRKCDAALWQGAWDSLTSHGKEAVRDEVRDFLSAFRALAEARGYRLMVPVAATMERHRPVPQEYTKGQEWWGKMTGWTAAMETIERALSAAPDPTKEPE